MKRKDKKSEELTKMNIIFMSGTMIVFALLVYTNQKTKHKGRMMSIVWFLNAYIVFRQSLSVFDYEEISPHIPNISSWHLMVLAKIISSIKTIIILFCCFEKKTHRSIIGGMLLVFTFVSLYAGTYGRQDVAKKILDDPKIFIFGLIFCFIQIRLFLKVSSELIETLQGKIE